MTRVRTVALGDDDHDEIHLTVGAYTVVVVKADDDAIVQVFTRKVGCGAGAGQLLVSTLLRDGLVSALLSPMSGWADTETESQRVSMEVFGPEGDPTFGASRATVTQIEQFCERDKLSLRDRVALGYRLGWMRACRALANHLMSRTVADAAETVAREGE